MHTRHHHRRIRHTTKRLIRCRHQRRVLEHADRVRITTPRRAVWATVHCTQGWSGAGWRGDDIASEALACVLDAELGVVICDCGGGACTEGLVGLVAVVVG